MEMQTRHMQQAIMWLLNFPVISNFSENIDTSWIRMAFYDRWLVTPDKTKMWVMSTYPFKAALEGAVCIT